MRAQTHSLGQLEGLGEIRRLSLIEDELPPREKAREPIKQPADAIFIVEMGERAEWRGAIGRKFLIGGAERMRQDERGIIEIEPDDLRVGQGGSGRDQRAKERALAGSRGTDDQLIGHAAEMRRRIERLFAAAPAGQRHRRLRRKEGRINRRRARPVFGRQNQFREIAGREQRAPHIAPAIARPRALNRFDRVGVFEPRDQTQSAEVFDQSARTHGRAHRISVLDDGGNGHPAEGHARRRGGDGFIDFGNLVLGVLINGLAARDIERLGDDIEEAAELGPHPESAFQLQLFVGSVRILADEAGAQRHLPRMTQQHRQHLRHGLSRIGGNAHRPHMQLANPGRHAAIPAFTGDNLVQAHLPGWHDRRVVAAGDAQNEIAEGFRLRRAAQADGPAKGIFDLGAALAETLQDSIQR